ncbi:hypothetical protein CYMTET_49972 [Cymbomonas tetramitiformis]|uniref:Uncharacterized protein n=1 Tax=Cymbomonas tetramitiformis TaxID=36881 RepID=A0AAE0ETC4_9CHLO|nr:hypothetical protein CYMTET_49972 [Cymbomonas tetramitiformis]
MLENLRCLAKRNDWRFSYDLRDGYHCGGFDPDFQKFMHFDQEAQELCQRVVCVSMHLGLWKNEKMGQWEPAKVHTDALLMAWSDVLNLKLEAQGQPGRCGDVVAPHKLQPRPDKENLSNRLDLHNIELQAYYIKIKLYRDFDLDDWKLSGRWFDWAERT